MRTEKQTLPRAEWVTLREDSNAIKAARLQFETAAERLNELNELTPIDAPEAFSFIRESPQEWIERQMLLDKDLARLAKNIPIENLKVPERLQRVKDIVQKGPIDFSCLTFENGRWGLDESKFDLYCDRFRDQLTERAQLERYNLSVDLAGILQRVYSLSEFQPGADPLTLSGFISNAIEVNATNRETPFSLSERFVKHGRILPSY